VLKYLGMIVTGQITFIKQLRGAWIHRECLIPSSSNYSQTLICFSQMYHFPEPSVQFLWSRNKFPTTIAFSYTLFFLRVPPPLKMMNQGFTVYTFLLPTWKEVTLYIYI
jgi:hypothetical protein